MSAFHSNRIQQHRVELQKIILKFLPREGEGLSGVTAQALIDHLKDHFTDNQSIAARLRKIQRELKELVGKGQVVVVDPNAHTHLYLVASSVEDNGIDPIFWGFLMKNFQQILSTVVPAKRLDAALEELRDKDQGIQLDEQIFQVAPDTLSLLPAQFNPVCLSLILQSLVEGKALEVTYRFSNGERKEMVLHPQGSVQSGPRFFLYALEDDEEERIKTYALHRFVSVKVLSIVARKVAHFDLKKAIEAREPNPDAAEKIRIVLLTRRFVTDLLTDCPLSEDQVVEDEDRYPGFNARVTATVTNSLLLERWLMGRGTNLCVLEPRSLAERLAEKAVRIAQLHNAPPRPQ